MDASALFMLVAGLGAGLFIVVYLIAADTRRFLTRFDLAQWRHTYYLRALPNFLQALHDNHFTTPWPAKRNAVAAAYFRFRTRPLLKMRPPFLRRAFVQQHITLHALLEILRPFLLDYVYSEQQRIAGDRVVSMEDTIERERLLGFLDSLRDARARFFASLTEIDRETLTEIIDRRLIPTLRSAHAIFQEHGYCLLPEFTQLRRWDEMTGAELVQELPAYTAPRSGRERSPSRIPARPR